MPGDRSTSQNTSPSSSGTRSAQPSTTSPSTVHVATSSSGEWFVSVTVAVKVSGYPSRTVSPALCDVMTASGALLNALTPESEHAVKAEAGRRRTSRRRDMGDLGLWPVHTRLHPLSTPIHRPFPPRRRAGFTPGRGACPCTSAPGRPRA